MRFRQDFQAGVAAGSEGVILDAYRSPLDRQLVYLVLCQNGEQVVVGADEADEDLEPLPG